MTAADAATVAPETRDVFKRLANDPVLFVREVLRPKTIEPFQIEALNALATHNRIAIRSGHGVGKTTLLAWCVLWWICTHYPAKVAATAPTAHQLYDNLWSEIALWTRRMPPWWQQNVLWKSDRVELKGAPAEHYAVARTARKEQPEALQGFHSEHMLFLIDEASGVDDIIFIVGHGSMTTRGAKTLMAGNPTRPSGFFHRAFHEQREAWHCIRVSCADSSQTDPKYAQEVADQYGLDSNIYRVRVLGEFPSNEDDVVIPLHLVEAAIARKLEPTGRVIWGVDCARFGSDRSTLAKRMGNTLMEPITAWSQLDTMQLAGRVHHEFRATNQRPDSIMVDVIGIGAGVVDRLCEMGLPAVGVNVSESPSVADRFHRQRDELWWNMRQWFENRDTSIPEDKTLVAELTAVRYKFLSSGKIEIEHKAELIKRGLRSPDVAEALLMTFAAGEARFAQRGYQPEVEDSDWET